METQTSGSGLDHALLTALSKNKDGVFSTNMADEDLNSALDLGCLKARFGLALSKSLIDFEIEEPDISSDGNVVAEVIFN